jgi:hypothetical protein
MNPEKKFHRNGLLLLFLIVSVCISCSNPGKSTEGRIKHVPAALLDDADSRPKSDREKTYFQHDSVLTYKLFGTEITTSGKTYLFLQVSASEQQSVFFPRFIETLGRFTVSRTSPVYRKRTGSNKTITAVTFELEPFLEGTYTVPRLEIVLEDAKTGKKTFFLTDEETVSVRPLLTEHEATEIETTGKAAIKDIVVPRSPSSGIFVIALVLIGAAAAGFMVLKRRRKKSGPSSEIPIQVRLDRELQRILEKRLPEQGKYMEHFVQLSNILRRYIEVQSGIRATEKTSEEFLKDMALHSDFREKEKTQVKEFLTVSDSVKFAAHRPSSDEVDRATAMCRSIIHSSRSITEGKAG